MSRPVSSRSAQDLPHAFGGELGTRLAGRRPIVFVDFDGTLSPIVAHAADAVLPPPTKVALEALAARTPVGVVSGRGMDDVAERVGLAGLCYAGSHGFEIMGPEGNRFEVEAAVAAIGALDAAERDLAPLVARGAVDQDAIEPKRFSVAIHLRNVDQATHETLHREIEAIAHAHGLRATTGRQVIDLQPDIDWHKGRAVDRILAEFGWADRDDVAPIFVGDDLTDEHGFEAIEQRGIPIIVRSAERADRPTAAHLAVDGTEEAAELLIRLSAFTPEPDGANPWLS